VPGYNAKVRPAEACDRHDGHGPADKHYGRCRTVGRRLVGSAYAIDDETAIKVVDGTVEVVSEGHWKLFTHSAVATESGY
jgi:hypothetical protein